MVGGPLTGTMIDHGLIDNIYEDQNAFFFFANVHAKVIFKIEFSPSGL